MGYLIELGISYETLEYMKKRYTKEELDSMVNCMGKMESSILYLREIGVLDDVIENILKNDYHVLMPGRKDLEYSLSKIGVDISQFVNAINTDLKYVDYLMNIN